MTLTKAVLAFIKDSRLFSPGDRVIVAVSGGADSIALAHVLIHSRAQLGIQLHLAHYNHKTRKSADADQRFVEKFARQFQVPLTVECRPRPQGFLTEDEARRLRFDFLVRLARQWKAQSVALAHTKSDVAETVLMRLIRGAGLYGLRGILPTRHLQGICFVRPLLDVKRLDVEKYLSAHKMQFCMDTSNLKTIYLRNKVRLELLPLLVKAYNPRMADALTVIAAIAQEDYDFLNLEATKRFKEMVVRSKGMVKIGLTKIKDQHPAMQRLLIRLMMEDLMGDPSALNFNHIGELEDLLSMRPVGSLVHLPQGYKARRTKNYLEISL